MSEIDSITGAQELDGEKLCGAVVSGAGRMPVSPARLSGSACRLRSGTSLSAFNSEPFGGEFCVAKEGIAPLNKK